MSRNADVFKTAQPTFFHTDTKEIHSSQWFLIWFKLQNIYCFMPSFIVFNRLAIALSSWLKRHHRATTLNRLVDFDELLYLEFVYFWRREI